MELETKVLSREIQQCLYDTGVKIATAESCTGGRVGEAIIATPGASKYFQGGIIAYSNNIKENILEVSHSVIEEQTEVCEEVAKQMVKGACKAMAADYAIATTGFAGPGGGNDNIPVGTIWIAAGTKENVITQKLTEDYGRDINLAIATNNALRLLLALLKDNVKTQTEK